MRDTDPPPDTGEPGKKRIPLRIRLLRSLVPVAIVAAATIAGSAGAALAHTGPHVHQMTTPNGKTHDVAAGLCNSPWDIAGDNFHHNVHVGGPDTSNGAPAQSITGSPTTCQ